MLKLRAKIADLQLRERPERAGRAAAKGEHGNVRTDVVYDIKRAGLRRTLFVGVRIGVQYV